MAFRQYSILVGTEAHIRCKSCRIYMWVVVKIMVLFGSLLKYGTYYLGYPKRDLNFDNHPCV